MKKSHEIAELFLKGRTCVRLTQKQFDWLRDTLIREEGCRKHTYLFFEVSNDSIKTKYRLNADGSLFNITKYEKERKNNQKNNKGEI